MTKPAPILSLIISFLITTAALAALAAAPAPETPSMATAGDSSVGFIRLDYQSTQDAPVTLQEVLNEAFKSGQQKTKGPISIYLSLTNDLNFLRLVGVSGNTDDYGYTHGFDFKIIGDLDNDYSLSLDYSSDLYTHPIEGQIVSDGEKAHKVKQLFTDENILKMVVTHKPEDKLFYWKAEVGWIELSSEYRKRYLNASTQQDVFHDFVNSLNPDTTKSPEYISNGEGTRDGALVGVYMGLAKTFHQDRDYCKKMVSTQVGARATTIDGTTLRTADANMALDCDFGFTKNRFRFETGYQVTGHDNGVQQQQYFDFSTKRKKWKFGFRVEKNSGDLVNYMDYNLPNVKDGTIDPIFRLYTGRDL